MVLGELLPHKHFRISWRTASPLSQLVSPVALFHLFLIILLGLGFQRQVHIFLPGPISPMPGAVIEPSMTITSQKENIH